MKKLFGKIWISEYEHNWKVVGSGILSNSPTGFHRVFKQVKGRVYLLVSEFKR